MDKNLETELLSKKNELLSEVGKARHVIQKTLSTDYKTAYALAWDSVCAKRYPEESSDQIKTFVMNAQAAQARRAKIPPAAKAHENGKVMQPVLIDTDEADIAKLEQQIEALKAKIAQVKEKNRAFKGDYIAVQKRGAESFRIRTRNKASLHIVQYDNLKDANKVAAAIENAVRSFVEVEE